MVIEKKQMVIANTLLFAPQLLPNKQDQFHTNTMMTFS